MSLLKRGLIPLLLCVFFLPAITHAGEHRFGLSGGAAVLYGDLKSSSGPGTSFRATYQYGLNRYLGIGLEGGVSMVEGDSEVIYSSSRYYGLHPYETTIIPLGVYARLEYPSSRIRPFIEGSAGVAVWFPGKQNDDSRLATEERVDSSVDPAGSIGGGLMLVLNDNWAIELGGRARYVMNDDLDNVDGDIVSGDDSWDDHLLEGGITLVYRFGTGKPAAKRPAAQAPPVRKPPERVTKKPPAPKPAVTDRDNDGIPDTRDGAPDEPEDIDGFEDDDGIPDVDNDGDGIPDINDPEPNTPRVVKPPTMELVVRGYSVHVSSFRTLSRANAEMIRLESLGIESFAVLTAIPDKGNMYRVYAGVYNTEKEAKKAGDSMLKKGTVNYVNPMKIDPEMKLIMPGTMEIFVHVSSFRTEKEAVGAAGTFSRTGYETVVAPADIEGKGRWFRVLIGPFDSRSEAAKAAEVIKAWDLSDYAAIIETRAP